MNIRAISCICIFLLLAFICPANSMGAESKLKTLFKVLEKEKSIALFQWELSDKTMLCIVSPHLEKIDGSTVSLEKLSIYEKLNGGLLKIYEFEDMDFFGVYQLYDGNLMSLWGGGSALHVRIFTITDKGNVKVILEEGVKSMPEIVDVDNDGIPELIFSSDAEFSADSNKVVPLTSRIYKWNDKSYDLVKTLPWRFRLGGEGK